MLAQNVYGFLHSVTHTAAQLNASLAGTQAGERVFRPNAAATAAATCAGALPVPTTSRLAAGVLCSVWAPAGAAPAHPHAFHGGLRGAAPAAAEDAAERGALRPGAAWRLATLCCFLSAGSGAAWPLNLLPRSPLTPPPPSPPAGGQVHFLSSHRVAAVEPNGTSPTQPAPRQPARRRPHAQHRPRPAAAALRPALPRQAPAPAAPFRRAAPRGAAAAVLRRLGAAGRPGCARQERQQHAGTGWGAWPDSLEV
jgi:hypothetical protein